MKQARLENKQVRLENKQVTLVRDNTVHLHRMVYSVGGIHSLIRVLGLDGK
jgi:hypothetical protein